MTPDELRTAREKDKRYAASHAKEKAEATKRWKLANPDRGYKSDPERFKAYVQKYRDNNREKVRADDLERYHKSGRYKLYGITFEQFQAMWDAQGGKCKICPRPLGKGRLGTHIDHDRSCCPKLPACGKCVRGLLCQKCNIGCGHFDDDPPRLMKAASYLRAYRDRRRAEDRVRESPAA